MKTVADILLSKEPAIHTIEPDAWVFDAVARMADKGIGALPVLEGSKVVGMFTERDYARKIALAGRSSRRTIVRDVMTSPVLYVRPDQTCEDCMTLMTGIRSRHLPVMDNDELIGLVSIGDVVKALISNQQFLTLELERHMSGKVMREEQAAGDSTA